MSHCWGLKCEPCNDRSPAWFNYGEETVRQVLRIWPYVRAIETVIGDDCVWRFDLNGLIRCEDDPHIFDFLAAHFQHGGLVLCDEYHHTAPLAHHLEGEPRSFECPRCGAMVSVLYIDEASLRDPHDKCCPVTCLRCLGSSEAGR